jgi:hypothetical protein
LPSLVAVTVAFPAATPVTTPFATLATPELFDDHVTVRPVNAAPALESVVAMSVCVWPTVIVADGGDIVTLATGSVVVVLPPLGPDGDESDLPHAANTAAPKTAAIGMIARVLMRAIDYLRW